MNRLSTSSRSGVPLSRRVLITLGSLTLVLLSILPGLNAQEGPADDLPVIEPRLTRIIGSDTLEIGGAALSPDGRWVVYSATSPGGNYLWVISSEGGEPSRLVETRDVSLPAWFPDGDRIAYWSFHLRAILTVPFDGGTGRASGAPRRVTLDDTPRGFRLSPDARWIAYRFGVMGDMVIKVIPSNGGTARTVVEPSHMLFVMDWSRDGQFIYYTVREPEAPGARPVMRVSVEGGIPQRVEREPTGDAAPAVPFRVRAAAGREGGGSSLEIRTYDARPVARFGMPQNARVGFFLPPFSQDGRHLLSVVSNTAFPLRLLPIAGGTPRQLGEARAWESPLGWSPDGEEVLFASVLDGRTAIMSAPVEGGAAREIAPMPVGVRRAGDRWAHPVTFSRDGRYLTYSTPTPGSPDRTLVVRSMANGEDRVITNSLFYHEAFRLVGPGGTSNTAGDEFLYLERNGDQVELRATPPVGPSRLLRSFSLAEGKWAKGVFGDRVAYAAADGEPLLPGLPPGRIVVAQGPGGIPREVASPESVTFDDIVWSPDGRWIAATTFVIAEPVEESEIKVLVVGVGPDGEVTVPARLIDNPTTGSAWDLRWLPDGSAVTLYGQSLPDFAFDIWLVPVQNGGRPQKLTRDETGGIGFN
ncbi:MAG: PD40 domain-containing protein, partial [Gemmatimonadetes bacterium]|nr:PD40 domain-containing protein [Gemmatimonadota bacterium]